jgi:predicted permease
MFISLISKILPLYIIAVQGYIAGKLHEIDTKSLSKIMFHFIMPVIFFDVALNTELEAKYALLPAMYLAFSFILGKIALFIGSKFFDDGKERIISYAAGSANTSSLGLSIAMLVFDQEYVRIFMLSTIGFVLYVYTIGNYTISNNIDSAKKRVLLLLKLPPIYGFAIGLVANLSDIRLFDGFNNLFFQMRAAYLVLGMMVFGLSLSKVKLEGGIKFISIFSISKIIVSPLLYLSFILLDKFVFHIYNNEMHKMFFILSALPPGIDCIITCNLYNKFPEKAAIALLVSTIIATLYIPFFLQFF